MPLRELNNHNTAKRMTETFGHSDNLITLSGAQLLKVPRLCQLTTKCPFHLLLQYCFFHWLQVIL